MAKLSRHDRQYTDDQNWLDKNRTAIGKAYQLLLSYLKEQSAPSRSELQRARALVDQANEMADKYPRGAPSPPARKAKRRVYQVRGSKALGAQLGRQAAMVADGLAETLEYDRGFGELADAIAKQRGIDARRAEGVAAVEVAKLVGSAIKRRFG